MSTQSEIDAIVAVAEAQVNKLVQKNELEKKLAKAMPAKFEENIQAFEKYLPKIAEEFYHFKPNSLQLFCAESGDLNIFQDGTALYGEDPRKQSYDQVQKVKEKPKLTSMSFSQNKNEVNDFIHTKYVAQMYNVYLDAKEKYEPMTRVPSHLGSAVIFGIGLGYHFRPLLEDVTIDHLYICEPNREMFYASLFSCDWKYVLETIDERDGNVVFNIGVEYEQFTIDFLNELKDKGLFNSVNSLLYQHYPSEKLTKLLKRFERDFFLLAAGWGFFDDGVISIAHEYGNAKRQIPLLRKDAKLPKVYANMPVFIVANGPSLDETLETIKSYQGQAVIFSCGSAITTLLKQDIIPDFHVALERAKVSFDFLREFCDEEKLKKVNFLTTTVMYPDCSDLFEWTGMTLKNAEPSTTIVSDYIDRGRTFAQMRYCNPQVANTALAFACYMGFEEIYLFGVDGGYKDPTHHHSKHSVYYKDDGNEKETLGNYIRQGELQVEGNFGGVVYSPVFYNTGRVYLEKALAAFKRVNCFNCSDGAKIENTQPLRCYDILLAPVQPKKSEMISFIKNELFVERQFNEEEFVTWVAYSKFNEIVDTMVEFVDKEFTSRAELAKALKEQVRYLFSHSQTAARHIYFLLEGTMTYTHSIFRMMLYGFEDEQKSVEVTMQAIDIFKEYMSEAKKKYARVLEEVDKHDSSLLSMFKDEEIKRN
jgi:hypothetical protein